MAADLTNISSTVSLTERAIEKTNLRKSDITTYKYIISSKLSGAELPT